jgi:hypothetical protein
VQPEDPIRAIALPLFQSKGWLRFLGVMSILGAVTTIIFTMGIGLIWAWLPIWIGVILFQSAGAIEAAYNSANRDQLVIANQKLKLYFIIQGVTTLIGIAFAVITLAIAGTGVFFGLLSEM